jgi:UDP-3-O-[3-hydroxymyristoyl] glucosamine N-acyltransferase
MKKLGLKQIAALVEGELSGDSSIEILGVSDLKGAREEHASFLGNPKYVKDALKTKAGVVVITKTEVAKLPGAVIRVDNPSLAFDKIARYFLPEAIQWVPGVHASAVIGKDVVLGKNIYIGANVVIEPKSQIGDNTHIDANTYIGHESRIGNDTFIYPNVSIRERSIIGNKVIIHSGVVIGSDGFGYEFKDGRYVKIPQLGYVQIDDHVEIGSNTSIDRGRFDKTWIQEGTKIDNLVQIAHNVIIGKHSVIVAQVGISGSSHLGQYVTLAGQVGVIGHIHIDDKVTVTAKTGVSKDLEKGVVYGGYRARPLREAQKVEAYTNRLPDLFKQVQELAQEVEKLKQKKP